MRVTYLGTTVLLFDDGRDQLLFDAHLTRPGMKKELFGRISTDTATADEVIRRFHMDRLRAIFVSHTHHDHALDAAYIAEKCGAQVHGSSSTLNVARGGSVKEEKLSLFEPGKEVKIGDFAVTVIPSVHSKAKWYNNDLGQTIDAPLPQPAKMKAYKEGGSFDFIVKHGGRTFVIRPSYNYIEGQFEGMRADVLFLGIAGIGKATEEEKKAFFRETVERLAPSLIIPLHWDNFFTPLLEKMKPMPRLFENTAASMYALQDYCSRHDVNFAVQLPLTSMEI